MILLHECADRQCADLDTEFGSRSRPCVFESTIRSLNKPSHWICVVVSTLLLRSRLVLSRGSAGDRGADEEILIPLLEVKRLLS